MPLIEAMRERLSALRPQILAPVAAAAAVLLMVAILPPAGPAPQKELTRAVKLQQPARVTAATTTLRERPDPSASALATLARGDRVLLSERRKDWYQVALPDGTQGWIEVAAFE